MVMIVIMVIMVIVAPARAGRRPLLGQLNGGLADKKILVDGDAAADRRAGGVVPQRARHRR